LTEREAIQQSSNVFNGDEMGNESPRFLDTPPEGQALTAYDREHMTLYMRLLDAARDGADWREVVRILFGLDPAQEPERCRQIHDAHLARARWMSEQGFRELVRESRRT
jgi:hypothetical protein